MQKTLLRTEGAIDRGRVTYIELFFDLVFVFAFTRITHELIAHFSPLVLLEMLLLLLAVWWIWIYTTWTTNWLDPQKTPVRLLLFVLMFLNLLLATSIPEAFGEKGWLFVLLYVSIQIGRTLFSALIMKRERPHHFYNLLRTFVWFLLAMPFWIIGAFVSDEVHRLLYWGVAIGLEYLGPQLGFWVPVIGASTLHDWKISGVHMAERTAAFVIIALGESILLTGGLFSTLPLSWTAVASLGLTTTILILMWWIYFNIGAEHGAVRIEQAADAGDIARSAYTYHHSIIVAGIILVGAFNEIMLAHPYSFIDQSYLPLVAIGPALYLLGNMLFKRRVFGFFPQSHIVGVVLILLIPFITTRAPLFIIACILAAILYMVAVWETVATKRHLGR